MKEFFFTNIKIENFKSLHNIQLKNCKRINLFIGKPNVGKSNILEAISFIRAINGTTVDNELLSQLVRYSNPQDLAFDGNIENIYKFNSNILNFETVFNFSKVITIKHSEETNYEQLKGSIKKYDFQHLSSNKLKLLSVNNDSLSSPFGENLLDILLKYPKILKSCRQLFTEYRLQLFFDNNERSLKIAKITETDDEILPIIYSIDYGLIADTLQRIIFYKVAIGSNQNNVLLFEEPEAHAFPPYITHLTQEIIDSTSNQFFITTHSPFVLTELLENARNELSVFVVNWVDGETTLKRLSDDELHDIYQYGIDIFTNIETFL